MIVEYIRYNMPDERAAALAAVRPFIGEIAEMRHYAPTDVTWTRAREASR